MARAIGMVGRRWRRVLIARPPRCERGSPSRSLKSMPSADGRSERGVLRASSAGRNPAPPLRRVRRHRRARSRRERRAADRASEGPRWKAPPTRHCRSPASRARQVSMPSPTISTSPGSAKAHHAAATGAEHHLRRIDRRLAAAVAGEKGAVDGDRRAIRPRVTSATIAGQTPPEGCFSRAWKRIAGGERGREPARAEISLDQRSVRRTASRQMASAASVRWRRLDRALDSDRRPA